MKPTLSWPRSDVVAAEITGRNGPLSVVAADGTSHPAQVVGREEGKTSIVFRPTGVPAMGYAVFRLSQQAAGARCRWT